MEGEECVPNKEGEAVEYGAAAPHDESSASLLAVAPSARQAPSWPFSTASPSLLGTPSARPAPSWPATGTDAAPDDDAVVGNGSQNSVTSGTSSSTCSISRAKRAPLRAHASAARA